MWGKVPEAQWEPPASAKGNHDNPVSGHRHASSHWCNSVKSITVNPYQYSPKGWEGQKHAAHKRLRKQNLPDLCKRAVNLRISWKSSWAALRSRERPLISIILSLTLPQQQQQQQFTINNQKTIVHRRLSSSYLFLWQYAIQLPPSAVEPRFNEPLFNKFLDTTNDFLCPG